MYLIGVTQYSQKMVSKMSVKIYNSWIVVDKNDPSYLPLSSSLTFVEREHKIRSRGRNITIPPKINYVFTRTEKSIYVPAGLKKLVLPYITNSEVHDYSNKNKYNIDVALSNIDSYIDILDGISLRKEQLIAIRKMIYAQRCIVQMPTGSGKTEVMCAFIKILSDCNNNGVTPTTLVVEPTIRLVNDTIDRFRKYDIPVAKYSDNREILENHVNICHPTSLGNDIEKNNQSLEKIEVVLGDECHHFRSETFRKPVDYMPNLIYSIGVSASAISQDNVNGDKISDFSYDELLTIGATGPLVMNVKPESLINRGALADPVLFILDNPADEHINERDIANWHEVSKKRLESDNRTELVCKAAAFFDSVDRKSLILVRTRRHAQLIMKELDKYNISDRIRASFGGGYFERYNGSDFVQDDNDVLEKYNSGEYTILIGTSHLYEGVDISNLDAMILAIGGKGERLQIQGVGRVLRKNKSGKYAWIIDFNDREDIILSKHSAIRLKRYKDTIGIPDNHIYIDMDIDDLPQIFSELENS